MEKAIGNKKFIAYLGYSQFPIGLAEVQRLILISKSLISTGNDVTVVCRNGIHNKKNYPGLKVRGIYENINYVYASGSCFRNDDFFRRRLLKIKGSINEVLFLRKCKKKKELDFAILTTNNFYSIIYYFILSKLLGFKTILNYVEYYSAISKGKSRIGKKFQDKLFDKYAPSLVDAIFPISEFILSHIKKVAPNRRCLKVPVLTDFERYKDIQRLNDEKFFLFCGDSSYKEVIYFIINSFQSLNVNTAIFLYLVINGDENNIAEIKKYVQTSPGSNKIKFFSRLTEKQLYTYYISAAALLIPLRPTFQDTARFPHKTGEYLASGNPVISTNYGEMKYYFKDLDDMLLAENYEESLFADKMQFIIDNPVEAQKIGLRGKNTAAMIFEYRNCAAGINNFLNSFNGFKK